MNKIQHTHTLTHTEAPAGQKAAVAISACTTAAPLTHGQIKTPVNSKIRIQTKSRNIPTEQKLMIMLGGSGEAWERPPTTQEMVMSLFLNSSQANPESCLLVLREAGGTMTLQKSSNRLQMFPNLSGCDDGHGQSQHAAGASLFLAVRGRSSDPEASVTHAPAPRRAGSRDFSGSGTLAGTNHRSAKKAFQERSVASSLRNCLFTRLHYPGISIGEVL